MIFLIIFFIKFIILSLLKEDICKENINEIFTGFLKDGRV